MDFKKLLLPSVVLTGALTAISYVMSKVGVTVQQLYAIQPVSAVTPTVGNKVIAFMSGYLPVMSTFAIPSILILLISSFLILLVGGFLYDALKINAKGNVMQLAAKILLGSALFYVLIVGLVMQQWQTFIGLAIHTLIAAYVTAWVLDMFK